MKKIFALFLAFTLLCLTACNTKPPVGTNGDGSNSSGSTGTDVQTPSVAIPENTLVGNGNTHFIHLPSRIMFHTSVAAGEVYNVYYSKADGKVYVYCFDPLCDHSGGKCLAFPSYFDEESGGVVNNSLDMGTVRFINGRFYGVVSSSGKIISFNFDGTDMKIEYDAGYREGEAPPNGAWSPNTVAYGPYLYIDQRPAVSLDGKKHTLRFNVETKEMVDLTEQTGHYAWPKYFYNDIVYADAEDYSPIKTNLDFTVFEKTEAFETSQYFSGNRIIYSVHDEKWNTIGIASYDVATGERTQFTNEMLGMLEDAIVSMLAMDEDYIYFYNSNRILAGYQLHPKTGQKIAVYKYDGKIYRAEHDGTNAVCIYDNPDMDYDINRATVFDGNTIIIYGNLYRSIAGDTEGLIEVYDSGYYVGTISEDGKIDELKLVEIVA